MARIRCPSVPDSEVRLTLRLALERTSESRDTSNSMILVPLLTRSSQTDLPQCCANFGFAALAFRRGLTSRGRRAKQAGDSSEACPLGYTQPMDPRRPP